MAADRFTLPYQQIFDSTPNVRAGGTLQVLRLADEHAAGGLCG
jgi:hypothetical protein